MTIDEGRKSGKGFFSYADGGKNRELCSESAEIVKKYSLEPVVPNTDEHIQMRVATRFINEAILCLQEGILTDPLAGDIGAVFGLGFPPFRGGPFRYVDHFGAAKMHDLMCNLQQNYGPQFEPCQLLKDHAKDPSKKFHVKK